MDKVIKPETIESLNDCIQEMADKTMKALSEFHNALQPYMDDWIDDFSGESTIKTDWLKKKMR